VFGHDSRGPLAAENLSAYNSSDMAKTAHIWTSGCQMNYDDSDQMAKLLESAGFQLVPDPDGCDLVVLNTCSVRDKPEHKVWTKLGELKRLKMQFPQMVIGVTGCMAQRVGEGFKTRTPFVDFVIGTREYDRIVEIYEQALDAPQPVLAMDKTRIPQRFVKNGQAPLKAFIPVQYGCDNYCTFCIVPYTRGREQSRPPQEIVAEIRHLAQHGCREVMLTGQNVDSYGKKLEPECNFAQLLRRVNDIDGLLRIRFMTSHPKDMSDELIDAIAELPKVCNQVHLPIQAGDDVILRKMARGYTVERFLNRVERIRRTIPNCLLTTDIIVGFPPEDEAQFQRTLDLVREVRFDSAFMFAYSPRPGTPAAKRADTPKEVKQERLSRLIALQNQITCEINESLLGQEFDVLCEGASEKDKSRAAGFTYEGRMVHFPHPAADSLRGQLCRVTATKAHLWGLEAAETA
jgi:tRNA-2-methylthio-N6-dimethylallyladenosine synthase